MAQLSVTITGTFDGCAPQIKTFGCDITGGSGDETYSWSSGTGDVSVLPSPTFSYINPGHYTVSVTVTSGGQTASASHEVVVFNGPTAAFNNTTAVGCVPYDFESQNLSEAGDAAIESYLWYFGDGYSSTEVSTTHTYSSAGIYTVSLEVTDANGCVNSFSQQQMFTLSKNPEVSISAHEAQWCQAPHEVVFSSNISTSGGLGGLYNVAWSFGDGGTSNEENPRHTYTRDGSYDVSLTVTDSYGCSTTVSEEEMVLIGTLAPEFNVPDQLCLNQDGAFSSTADGECVWTFGDGTPDQSGANVHHTYTQEGTYPVTFVVDPNGPCRSTMNFQVEVVRVEASFTTMPTNLFSCTYPFEVQFTSTSVGENLTYYYSFGDSRIETEANVSHSYLQNGEFTPVLTVTSPGGCTSRFTGPTIVIRQPNVSLSLSESGGCIPLLVEFSNGNDPSIVDFLWDYGDGTTEHTTVPTTEHLYGNLGTYSPTLTVTDTAGCVGTGSAGNISTGTPILPEEFGAMDSLHNYIPHDTICASDTIYLFNSMYEDRDTLDYVFIIDFNGSPTEEQSHETYHEYSFENDTGWAYIGLRVDYNKCKSDTLWWDSIYVVPPIVKISSRSDCSSPFDYVYKINKNVGAEYWDWIVFDEETGDTLQYVEHSSVDSIVVSYPSYGSYSCKIIAHNDIFGVCDYEDKVRNEIVEPVMDWSISRDTICAGNRVTINIDEAASFADVAFNWTGEDISLESLSWTPVSSGMTSSHEYADSGDFDVKVYARKSDGCISIFTDHIYVVSARASILPASLAVGCAPATFEFEIVPETNDPLQYVVWGYGDGSPADTTYTPYTPVEHTYENVGTYEIIMRLSTVHGCKFSKIYYNRIKVVDVRSAEVDIDVSNICLGGECTFASVETDNSIWHEWDLGDGTLINGHDGVITHVYAQPGHYNISHIVSEQSGSNLSCGDTARYENAITVESLTVAFSLDSTDYNCYPISPTIHNNVQYAPDDIDIRYTWDMGDGDQTIQLPNPQYLYTLPGSYDITLEVETPAGCHDVVTHSINITGPEASISLSDTIICAGGVVNMSMVNASNVESVLWVVGGGYTYNTPNVSHHYEYVPESGYFPVTMSVRNGSCTIDFTEQVYVYKLPTGFSLFDVNGNLIADSSGICSPFGGLLEHEHQSDCMSQWFVNDSLFASDDVLWINESRLTDSLFTVKIIVTDSLGCIDSLSHEYTLYHQPDLKVSNDTTICFGDTLRLRAWDAHQYYWDEPIADSLPSHELVPEVSTLYRIDAYSDKMCKSVDSVYVRVIPAYDINVSDDYFTINMGDTAVSYVTYNNSTFTCFIMPEESVTMSGCDTIIFYPKETADYVLIMQDTTICPDIKFDIHVEVERVLTVDVPGAFTPLSEGDGNNIVYVRGIGIKNLLQFRIYNRWGEEVFFSDDLNKGWDGTVNGKVQGSDTYSYYLEAEMFDGSIKTKKGNVMLIK